MVRHAGRPCRVHLGVAGRLLSKRPKVSPYHPLRAASARNRHVALQGSLRQLSGYFSALHQEIASASAQREALSVKSQTIHNQSHLWSMRNGDTMTDGCASASRLPGKFN